MREPPDSLAGSVSGQICASPARECCSITGRYSLVLRRRALPLADLDTARERSVFNIGKGGFQFAHAPLIPRLMSELERGPLRGHTPCRQADEAAVAHAIAEVHAELVLVHPFRDGNGRLARLLALLMALQADLPPLEFSPIAGRGRRVYIAAIHAAMGADYAPLEKLFFRIIVRSQRLAASSRR